MASSTIFISAIDARQNPIRETVVHDEARAIETAILESVRNGFYQATLSSGSPMTSSSAINIAVASIDMTNDQLYVPNHPFSTGDLVTVSSNGSLPSPLSSTAFYSVIYIDADHIKLATSGSAANMARPVSIDFTVGVTNISLTDQGAGYLSAPRVMIDMSPNGRTATATAILATYGSIDSVSLLTPGSGYTDVPSVTVTPQGIGATAGAVSFTTVSVSVASGGSNYRLGDVLSVSGGTGTAATATVTGIGPNGSVLSVALGTPGLYSSLPALSNVATTVQPGGGTSCTLNLNMGIGAVDVAIGGTGYSAAPLVTVTGGNGSGAYVEAIVNAGTVASFIVTNPGSGYTAQPLIGITSGSGANLTAVLKPTPVASLSITNDGSGSYVGVPNVTISAIGSGATAGTITMLITSAQITNAGGGYKVGDVVLVAGGAGTENASIQVTTVGNLGQILSYSLVTSGSYTVLPLLRSNNVLGGNGRSATFDLTAGVRAISVGSPGAGYTTPPTVLITPSDGYGIGGLAQATLNNDVVDNILVTNAGTGYTAIPTVEITSGSGAQAVAVINNGSITQINMIDHGRNYTCVPLVTIDGLGTAKANLSPTSIGRIDVLNGGANWVSAPIITLVNGPNQTGSVILPTSLVNIGYSLKGITVTDAGSGYNTVPNVVIDPPQGQQSQQALASAELGSGTGTMIISLYPQAIDYWKVWKNQSPSNSMYVRPYAERMDTVIAYFTSLGYTINRLTNSATGNTISWQVMW